MSLSSALAVVAVLTTIFCTGWSITFAQKRWAGAILIGIAIIAVGILFIIWGLKLKDSESSQSLTPGKSITQPSIAGKAPEERLPLQEPQQKAVTHPHHEKMPVAQAPHLAPNPSPTVAGDPLQLSSARAKLMGDALLRSEAGKFSLRIVDIAQAHQDLAAQLFNEFHDRAGWQVGRVDMGMFVSVGFNPKEPLYVLSSDVKSSATSSVISALGAAGITAPIHPFPMTLGPGSLGVPDVTIVLQ